MKVYLLSKFFLLKTRACKSTHYLVVLGKGTSDNNLTTTFCSSGFTPNKFYYFINNRG